MKKRILLFAAAVALALVGTLAVYSYGHNADQRATASTRATTVLVAGKRVSAGTTWADAVKNKYVISERMPAGSTPASALTTIADAAVNQDAVAQSDIAPGQIVLRESFGTAAPETGALAIPKGMIAVSVSLPSNADVAGYVAPNAQVVIFQTSQVTGSTPKTVAGQQPTVTATLVPRALVIATSQAAPTGVTGNATATSSATIGSELVTLALSQHDAQRVILGQKIGDLYLGLLSSASVVNGSDPGVINVGALTPAKLYAN